MTVEASKAIKIGMIGAGSMAPEHIKAFNDIEGVEVVGIQNRTRGNAEKVAAESGVPYVADSIADLYNDCSPDLVVVAVYEPAIESVIMECLKYPWSILMEKPVGMNFDEAKEIQLAALNADRTVWVGLNRRTMSSTIAALESLSDVEGERYIYVQDQQGLDGARALGHIESVVENWMYANSIHLIDYLLTFGRGKVQQVQRIIPWNPENPGVVLAKIEFDSGDTGIYEGIWHGPGPWACTVTTSDIRWEMRPLEHARYQLAGERVLHDVEVASWDAEFKPGFRNQAEQVVAALRGHKSAVVSLDNAVEGMRLVSEIFQTK